MSEVNSLARRVFDRMYAHDAFSQWLGIELITVGEGAAALSMTVRPDMLNGFAVAHGAITYALADSAFAFACNSFGRISVSVETSITHTQAVRVGDVLTAEAALITQSNKIGTYQVTVFNQHRAVVAVFKGVCYRTEKQLDFG
jgi:acyl-CoA thioesterase